MPRKNDDETGFAGQARSAIKAAMDEMGLQVGGLFVLLYEREPIGSEVQTLRNRLNRGNPVMRLKNAPPAAAADG